MRSRTYLSQGRRALITGGAALSAILLLAGCGGQTINNSAAKTLPNCMNLAVNPWTGYEADAAVIQYVAKTKLNCNVAFKQLAEEPSWQGFGDGSIDVVIEDWGHPELMKKYVETDKTAMVVGQTGNEGLIGWYVPKWMAEKYPDITDWKNLNKYASLFKNSESGDKGAVVDGDPSYLSYDEALVKNLKLDFTVTYTGSEEALITAFRSAKEKQTAILGYFYEPQWLLKDLDLVRVSLPKWDPKTCFADKQKAACDYAPTPLPKIARTAFIDSGTPAANLVKKFNWTNEDQNSVAFSIGADKMTDEQAAKKWVDANPSKVSAWLS